MLNRELYTIQAITFIVCPISIPIYIIFYILDKHDIFKYKKIGLAVIGVISLVIAFFTHAEVTAVKYLQWFIYQIIPGNFTWPGMSTFLISDFYTIGGALLLSAFCLLASEYTSGEQTTRAEKQKEQAKKKYKKFTWLDDVNSLTLGTTGSGKTVRLNKALEVLFSQPKQNRDFFAVVDGKGAAESDTYGIFNTMVCLSKRYRYPFVVVNATNNKNINANITPYNPFYGLTAEEIKEMVSVLIFSDNTAKNAGAEYYKNIFDAWLLTVVELMLQCGEYISLPNITKLLDKENFISWLEQKQNSITAEQRKNANKQLNASWNDIRSTVIKLQTFMRGMGGQIFSGSTSKTPFNLRYAYKHNIPTLFLISELAVPEFAAGLGALITLDARVLISNRLNGTIDTNKKCKLFMDEFSAVVNSSVLSILSRARSSGSSLHLFSQSVSDIKQISPEFLGAVLDNITTYYIYRQNNPESAEELAAVIGTEITTKLTAVASDAKNTGLGTHRATREYRIHPDTIKTLKNNECIRYDKMHPDQLAFVKNEFVKLESDKTCF